MHSNRFSSLLMAEPESVQALIATWQERGASALGFTIENETQVLWLRPEDDRDGLQTQTQPPMLCAPLAPGAAPDAAPLGQLWVRGVASGEAQQRLRADAGLLSALLQRELEMDELAREFVETQDQLLALYDLNRSLHDHISVQEALADLADQTARMMKSQWAFALLSGNNRKTILVQHPQPFGPDELMQSCATKADVDGPVVLRGEHESLKALSLNNALVLCTRLRSGELVSMGWANRSIGDFGSPEIKLAQALVEQAGARVESVLRHENRLAQARINAELELARDIQERLLPKASLQLAHLDIAASTRPAFEMGGDFYDYAQFAERPLMFCVGDVSGKGLAAAAIMSAARAALRTHSRYMDQPSPAAILSRTNEDLEGDLNSAGKFVTVFVGQYCEREGRLCYANAGHSPVILKQNGQPAYILEADAPPLGVLSDLGCADECVDTQIGDVLVIASDGLPEAENARGEMFGYTRLTQAVDELAHLSSADIVAQLLARVRLFADGRSQTDDQTLLVVKRKA